MGSCVDVLTLRATRRSSSSSFSSFSLLRCAPGSSSALRFAASAATAAAPTAAVAASSSVVFLEERRRPERGLGLLLLVVVEDGEGGFNMEDTMRRRAWVRSGSDKGRRATGPSIGCGAVERCKGALIYLRRPFLCCFSPSAAAVDGRSRLPGGGAMVRCLVVLAGLALPCASVW